MNQPNIYWIIIDSVRTYKTGIDDRDRIDAIDYFALQGIEFTKAYTSAPSSVLSGSSMFTALPATYISRHFSDWDFNSDKVETLQNTLINKGYSIYSIFNSREERRMLRSLIHPISADFYPQGVSHRNWWTNHECTQIFKNAFEKHQSNENGFFTIWYDCRKDPTINDEILDVLDFIKSKGNFEDSIIIMSSDHGYPDPSSGLTEETMKKFSHDMIITEDNIRVPLVMKFPGGPRSVKIPHAVGLKDVFPTINDFLGIPEPNKQFSYRGASLLPLLDVKNNAKKQDRLARIDTRLNMAAERITALVSGDLKYVKYWDDELEELYNLNDDPNELINLLDEVSKEKIEVLDEFRDVLEEMENELNSFLLQELEENIRREITKITMLKKSKHILIFSETAPDQYLHLLKSILTESHNKALKILIAQNISEIDSCADVAFYITESTKTGAFNKSVFKSLGDSSDKVVMMDFNGKIFNRFLAIWVWPAISYFRENSFFYKSEPYLVFYDLIFVLKAGVKKVAGRKSGLHIDGNKVKRMRDRELKALNANGK